MAKVIYKRFSDFEEKDQKFLASVPYRTGVWMSYYDEEGGDEATEREISALNDLINIIAGNYCESSFLMDLFEYTLQKRGEWPVWRLEINNVLDEVHKSIIMLEHNISYEDLTSYKSALMEIALGVARAYGEKIGQKPAGNRIAIQMQMWLDHKLLVLAGREDEIESAHDELKISARENEALEELSLAIDADVKEMLEKYHERNE